MADAIAVINAGSSSVKFSLFLVRDGDLTLEVRGQVEGLSTSPRLVVRDSRGRTVSERSWGEKVRLGHDDAVEHLRGSSASTLPVTDWSASVTGSSRAASTTPRRSVWMRAC